MDLKYRIFLLFVFLFVLAACGSSASNTGTAVTPTATNAATATTPPQAQHFKVGDTVRVGDVWDITITSAKNGGTASYLKPGQVFLDITVKVRNISTSEQSMSSLVNWTVRDTDGNTYTAGYDPAAGSVLNGKVEAGQPLQGSLTFVVKDAVHQYLLFFQVNFGAQGQTIWDIKM